jgi:ribonuclease PH
MNLVMTGKGKFVEIQGTAEKTAFTDEQLGALLRLGTQGIQLLVERQRQELAKRGDLKRLLPTA